MKVQSKPVVGNVGGQRYLVISASQVWFDWALLARQALQNGVLASFRLQQPVPQEIVPISVKVTQANREDSQAMKALKFRARSRLCRAVKSRNPFHRYHQFPPPRTFTTDDALRALRMSVKLLPEDLVLDLDENGQITSNDARIILRRVTKRE